MPRDFLWGIGGSPHQFPIIVKPAHIKSGMRGKIMGAKRPKFGTECTFLEHFGNIFQKLINEKCTFELIFRKNFASGKVPFYYVL